MYFSGWHARIGKYEDRWILGGQTILRWQILKKQKQRLQQISSYRMFRPCLCTNNHFQGIEWNTWLYLYRYLLVHIYLSLKLNIKKDIWSIWMVGWCWRADKSFICYWTDNNDTFLKLLTLVSLGAYVSQSYTILKKEKK